MILDMLKAVRSRLAWAGLLLLISIGFYWKLVLTDQYTYLDNPDLVYQQLPWFQFQATEWRHLRLPLWDPHQWCGQPFLGQVLGAAYPLNWVLPHLPFDRGKIRLSVLHWYFVLIHFQGALFAYWLCRDLKRSRAASLLAGLVFTLGAFMSATDWPQHLNGAVWAPAALLFLLRALRGQRPFSSAALCGVFVGAAWLSGHHEVPIYLTITVGAVWLFYIVRGQASRRRLLALAVVTAALMVLTSGLQTLPAYEYGRLALRWAGAGAQAWNEPVPYFVHQHLSFTPASLLGMVLPGRFQHMNPFVGLVALSLALFALASAWKSHPPVRLCGVIALLGLLFSLGGENVFHGFLYSVIPLFDKARAPARALVIFNLGVAPLIAFGLDALRDEPRSAWLRRLIWGLAAVALGIFAVSGGLSIAGRLSLDAPVMFTGLAAALLAALFAAWRAQAIGGRALAVSLVLLSLFELGRVADARMADLRDTGRPSLLAGLRANDDVASFLRGQPKPLRVDVSDGDIPSNFGDWHSIDTLGGYMPGVTANVFQLGTHAPRVQDLLAVSYRVARKPSRPDQQLVFQGASGVNVYRNPAALPRARVVHELVRAPSYEELGKLHAEESFDLRGKAAMLGPPPELERCAGAEEPVSFAAMPPSRVVLDATLGCRGMVVLADTAFPGWKAKVDGRPVAIHEVSGALRGVVVERGRHRIEMTYRPASVTLGALMTLTGLLAACLLRRFSDLYSLPCPNPLTASSSPSLPPSSGS